MSRLLEVGGVAGKPLAADEMGRFLRVERLRRRFLRVDLLLEPEGREAFGEREAVAAGVNSIGRSSSSMEEGVEEVSAE